MRKYIALVPGQKGNTMLDLECRILEMIRKSSNSEEAIEIAIKVILDFLAQPQSSE